MVAVVAATVVALTVVSRVVAVVAATVVSRKCSLLLRSCRSCRVVAVVASAVMSAATVVFQSVLSTVVLTVVFQAAESEGKESLYLGYRVLLLVVVVGGDVLTV